MPWMLSTLLRNVASGRATRLYPHERRAPYPGVRGELVLDKDKCSFCVRCQMACPVGCITVDRKEATWSCDPFACVYCGICSEVCSEDALHHEPTHRAAAPDKPFMRFKGVLKPKKKPAKS